MKIGILTLPLHTNFGGILQAWALQTVLERMGHDVEVIRVSKSTKRRGTCKRFVAYGYRFVRNFFRKEKTEVLIEYYAERMNMHTNRFIKTYIRRATIPEFAEENLSQYDAIVFGSDQIWRRPYIGLSQFSISDAFGETIADSKIRCVSYAASFGVEDWEYTEEETAMIKHALKGFSAVSVREDSGVELCRRLGIEAKHVLDPTMLLDKSDYMKLIENYNVKPSNGTLMTYVLDESPEKVEFINKVAKDKGLVAFKSNNPNISNPNARYKERQQPPLEQWLKGFADAEFVVTDSFHACVFSILFGKPFIALGNAERGMARFESLLRMFGLLKHLVANIDEYDPNDDYSIGAETIERLNELRQDGYAFLSDAISK